MNLSHLLSLGDGVTLAVALLLLAMSVASWVVILWKAWLLRQASQDVARCTAAFWQSASVDEALAQLQAFDRLALLVPMVQASNIEAGATLATAADKSQQLTRVLRNALHLAMAKLQYGQVLLATVGSTAPFVGLLGTVWGIYHALTAIGISGQASIDKVAGPVGEALIMTAIGLAVAVPAVLAYNWLVRRNKAVMDEVRAFGSDLHAVVLSTIKA